MSEDKINSILEDIEKRRGGILISYNKFRQENPVVAGWFDTILRRVGTSKVHVFKIDKAFKLALVTALHEYDIQVSGEVGGKDSYLGCICNNRMSNPGETHKRVSDLPDGKLTINVFLDIVYAIVGNECLELINSTDLYEKI